MELATWMSYDELTGLEWMNDELVIMQRDRCSDMWSPPETVSCPPVSFEFARGYASALDLVRCDLHG